MITPARWFEEHHQVAALSVHVPEWLQSVPLYQNGDYRRPCWGGAARFLDCFRTLPFITKHDIRHGFPRNFLGDSSVSLEQLVEQEHIEIERTSGTSDEQVTLLLERGWWPRQERWAFELNAVVARRLEGSSRRVTIVSPVCSGDICYTATPGWSERIVDQALFVNLSRHPFLWTQAHLERMARETAEWNPVFLDVDPVYAVLMARFCEHHHIRFPSLQFIVASYEFVSQVHRRVLERVFRVPVFDLYGSTETGHLLMETETGDRRANHQVAYLEVVQPDHNGIGDLVVTTLTNPYMPLIRYRIGDLVKVSSTPQTLKYELHGRARDALTDTTGQRVSVGQIDACFADMHGVLHYQLRQTADAEYTLLWVPDGDGLSAAAQGQLHDRLADRLKTQRGLRFQAVDYLPCENSGKFRLSCAIPSAQGFGR